jgi:putative spermidine/putrescine transport system ATP-binding protein
LHFVVLIERLFRSLPMTFMTLKNVNKSYGATRAVIDMSLSVQKGEFVSLLGPSGCGKTTTLQMIAGFADVTSGSINLDGRDITHAKPNSRGLGIVFQSYALFPHMSVYDNVSFGLEMRKVDKKERIERVKATLALVHLEAHALRYPRELSGGQRQRVALARALVIEPPVLLLDEPLSNLDAKLREEMQFELRQIQRKVGTTTVMVTHDQTEAMSISDRVVVMEAGRVTQIDPPHRLYEHPQTRFISSFVGKANLLEGRVSTKGTGTWVTVELGSGALSVQAPGATVGDAVVLSLRPEKIRLVVGRGQLAGRVRERFFLGSQWLYSVTTLAGDIVVICSNDGSEPAEEGQNVGLDWHAAQVRLLAGELHQKPVAYEVA